MRTTASNITVTTALMKVNQQHGYKLEFNRFERKGNYIHFTIQSESSGIPGSRTSWSGRKLKSASWHAHGYLFDEIFKIEPEAVIYSLDRKITADAGNWKDKNIGSIVKPVMFSQTSIL